MDAAQNHAFDAVEVVESILRGLADGAQKWLARILARHPQQLPQGESADLAAFSFQELVQAYFDCRENKRNTYTALSFEVNVERNLQLHPRVGRLEELLVPA